MAVQALGYLGISTQNIELPGFVTRQSGLMLVDREASCRAFRIDDRRQRVIVDKQHPDVGCFFGREVADAASFDALAGKLEAAGVAVPCEPAAIVNRRFFRDLISFRDPAETGSRSFTMPDRFLALRRSARGYVQ
jgi:hypothetical protein